MTLIIKQSLNQSWWTQTSCRIWTRSCNICPLHNKITCWVYCGSSNSWSQIFPQELTFYIMTWILQLSNSILIEWIQRSRKYIKEKFQYLLDNDFIESSNIGWSFPVYLMPKADGSYCIVYGLSKTELNSVSKTDSFSIARIEDCILWHRCLQLHVGTKSGNSASTAGKP